MRRLALVLAVVLAACTSGDGDTADTEGPTEPEIVTTTEESAPVEPGSAAAIELSPVLAGPQPCDTFDATATTLPVLAELPEAGCVELGPAAIDGSDLARAEAILGGSSGGEWVVEVEVADDVRAEANAVFDACATHGPTCPTALVAIVVDGAVVASPSSSSAGLADRPFVISGGRPGGFSQAEAEEIAERIG